MIRRKLVSKIIKQLNNKETIVIIGARQVGKTTIIKYILENHIKENYFYMDLEFKKYLELCNKGPEETYTFLLQKGMDETKKIYLVIDEIQYLKDPTNFIKLFSDHYKNIQLIVSGSSTFEIKKKFKNSLVGRTIQFTLYPLDFEEFLLFKEKKYVLNKNNSTQINKELVPLFEEFVKYGVYPEVVLKTTEEEKELLITQIINTYIQKDIRDLGRIKNIEAFNKLIKLIGDQSGELLNITDLANIINISQQTVEEYIFLLEQTFILKRITPYHNNIRTELTKSPKIYFIDTGILNITTKYQFPIQLEGNTFETTICSELIKNNQQTKFWRTTNKQEIDFIIQTKKEIIPIEVKLNFKRAKSSAIKYFDKKYKTKGTYIAIYGDKKENANYPWEIIRMLKEQTEK